MIRNGHGSATLTTKAGDTLTSRMPGKGFTLKDEKGGVAHATIATNIGSMA